jgi:hypothetical protein
VSVLNGLNFLNGTLVLEGSITFDLGPSGRSPRNISGEQSMDKTNDSYNFYYDGTIKEDQEARLAELLEEHNLGTVLLGAIRQHYNFTTTNSYNEHKILLWVLWQALASYAVTVFFVEDDHPAGCEYQAKVDFVVHENGAFEYDLKNSLWIHEDEPMLDECKQRIEKKQVGFENDRKVRGNITQLTLESFIEAVTKG